MSVDAKEMPESVEALQQLVVELKKELHNEKLLYTELEEKYNVLRQKFFGKSSEKISDLEQGQKLLFNEAEDGSTGQPVVDEVDNKDAFVTVPEHKRKKTDSGRHPPGRSAA